VSFDTQNGIFQSDLSAVEHGRDEVEPKLWLAISREFGKSLEWLLQNLAPLAAARLGICQLARTRTIPHVRKNSPGRTAAETGQVSPGKSA
jgi:hypothetical protein